MRAGDPGDTLHGDADADRARFDIVFRGARVLDGTGGPAFAADVAVAGDRVAAVGRLDAHEADVDVDAAGLALAPGFIDVHTHDDCALIERPAMHAKVSQGVTTVVAGNCGVSLAPITLQGWPPAPLDLLGDGSGYRYPAFGDYVSALERAPPATNAALLVGHITLRFRTMPSTDRAATDAEIASMCELVEEAMEAGAIGFSNGLDYPPSVRASTGEVIALAGAAAGRGGLYASHTRDYFEDVEEALEEAFLIAREAGAALVLSHHQVTGSGNFGRSRGTLERIERARRAQPVGLDAYPYAASSKVLDPERAQPGVRILVTWSRPHPEASGRDLDEIAAEWDLAPREAAERLLPAGAVYFQLCEEDVRRILAYPHTMIGSDGLPHDAHPHPRLWGTFPRVVGRLARDQALMPVEEAVRRMTSLPAACFGLAGRGVVAPEAFADLVLFDPDSILDLATWEAPTRPAAGIETVLVNGEPVWRDGAPTGARPGRVLRRAAPAGGVHA